MSDQRLQAQVTALQKDVGRLGDMLREVMRKLDIAVDAAPRHVVDSDGRTFIPGTGKTGTTAADEWVVVESSDGSGPTVERRT